LSHFPDGSALYQPQPTARWPAGVSHGREEMATSADQRRALRMLAGAPQGCTTSVLLAHGFKIETVSGLVRRGLATMQPGTMRAGRRQIKVVWVMITDAGRRALAG
jgi:hypothetical protein